jgi:hypothetical protein
MFSQERLGSAIIDHDLIRSCVNIYRAMGDVAVVGGGDSHPNIGASKEVPSATGSSAVYVADLETPLVAAARFYLLEKYFIS